MGVFTKLFKLPLLQKPVLQQSIGSKRHVAFTFLFYLIIGWSFASSFLFFSSRVQEISHIESNYGDNCEPLQRRVNTNGGTEPLKYTFIEREYEIGDKDMLELIIQNKPEEFLSKLTCDCVTKVIQGYTRYSHRTNSNYRWEPDPLKYYDYIPGYICKSDYQEGSVERVYLEIYKRLVDEPQMNKCSFKDGTPEQVQTAFAFHYNSTRAAFDVIRDKIIEANGPYLCNTTINRSMFESISLSFSVMSLAISVAGFILRQLNSPKQIPTKDENDSDDNETSDTNNQHLSSISSPYVDSVSMPPDTNEQSSVSVSISMPSTPSSSFNNTPSTSFNNTPSTSFNNTPSTSFNNTPSSSFNNTPPIY
jgi:hypothetical protein